MATLQLLTIEIFDPLCQILGILFGIALIGLILSFTILEVYSFFRPVFLKFFKKAAATNFNIESTTNKELFAIITIGYITIIVFSLLHFELMQSVFYFLGLFGIAIPFFTVYYLPKKKDEILVKIIVAIFLLLCLLNLTTEDYHIVKYILILGFVFLIFRAYNNNFKLSMGIYIALASLYQPFIYVLLKKSIWNILDALVAISLIGSIFIKQNDE